MTAAITYYIGTNPTNPGNGGDPGEPGNGGKVWQTTLDVQPGQKFQITIGVGGVGGTAGYESVAGSEGGATLFGDLSSESGGVLPGGFLKSSTGPFMLEQVIREWLVAEAQEGQMTPARGKTFLRTPLL